MVEIESWIYLQEWCMIVKTNNIMMCYCYATKICPQVNGLDWSCFHSISASYHLSKTCGCGTSQHAWYQAMQKDVIQSMLSSSESPLLVLAATAVRFSRSFVLLMAELKE